MTEQRQQDTLVWILTFNRPEALNRLISTFGRQGWRVNVFSNHPHLQILDSNKECVQETVINTLNSTQSNSWCARSWNSILLRSWHRASKVILIQDDTLISDGFVEWFNGVSDKYDFMWGPGGDQWHYLTFEVFKKIGYWDERYIGCYCGDADYLKRVWHNWNHDRISVEEKHNWGFTHNPSGIEQNVLTEMHIKVVDSNYENQHWQLEGGNFGGMGNNPTLLASQQHYAEKWGEPLDSGQPITASYNRKVREIDWYPWFSKRANVRNDL